MPHEKTANEESPLANLGDLSIGIVPANDETSSTPWLIGALCLSVAAVILILTKAPAYYAAPQPPATTAAKPTFEDRWSACDVAGICR